MSTATAVLPPLFATLHLRPAGWRFGLRLWLPLFLLWLLLLTVLILALPLLLVACIIFGVDVWRSARAVNAILAALHGTRVEVAHGDTHVLIQVH